MFLVLLELSENKAMARQHLDDHNAWLRRGFDDGVFLLSGSLKPDGGGGIVAHATTLEELEQRVSADPFVAPGVVSAKVVEIAPGRVDERLAFLRSE